MNQFMHFKFQLTLILLALSYHLLAQEISIDKSIDNKIIQLTQEFKADIGSLTRFYFIKNSPERRNRLQSFFNTYLLKIDAFPFDKLSKKS